MRLLRSLHFNKEDAVRRLIKDSLNESDDSMIDFMMIWYGITWVILTVKWLGFCCLVAQMTGTMMAVGRMVLSRAFSIVVELAKSCGCELNLLLGRLDLCVPIYRVKCLDIYSLRATFLK